MQDTHLSMMSTQAGQRYEELGRISEVMKSAVSLWFFRFPEPVEQAFIRRRVEDSQMIIRVGRLYLLVIVGLLFLKNILMHQDLLSANHYQLIKTAYVPLGLAVCGIIVGHRIPFINRHLYAFMIIFGALAVYAITISAFLIHQPLFAGMVAIYVAVTISLVTFGLRIVIYHYAPLMLLTGGLAVLTALLNHWPLSPMLFLHYYVLFSFVMLALAAITERRERKAFLQGLMLDIQTDRLQTLNEQLAKLAQHDGLTGLYNRRAFDTFLEREWDHALRDRKTLSVLFLDVDFFKLYNDALGHSAGDLCLQKIAQALSKALHRSIDIVARYGGEEFVILLPGTDAAGAEEISRRIMESIRSTAIPHPQSTVATSVTLSIGISTRVPQPSGVAGSLVREADMALYQAKNQGRNRFVCFRD
ncbi:MAG: diguanylate cyclase [Fluviicoccus sp.]|uniref:GGDEF domain-containing protein n=1 Tax=Fluviicoccus sp. TaxID=2003552 RepID=UPI0027265E55|nr:diguanylate cyclase [Fluviicoccus sp.]MDO8330791.1 diguanylate cyclase [Fluviicoccus sp.]